MSLYEMRKFVAPEFIFGVGSRRRVGYYARNMMARRVMIVSDAGVESAGWLSAAQGRSERSRNRLGRCLPR
jgi:alcohol dehydrogenase